MEYILIFLSLLCTSSGQLLQKLATNKIHAENSQHFIIAIASRRETWFAVFFLALGMLFWLAVLYLVDVSTAYPFLSIGLILVMLASHFYLKETISPKRVLGAALVIAGITLVAIA